MSKGSPTDTSYKTINVEFLRASASFALAWGCWLVVSPDGMIFGYMAVIFAVIGAKRLWFGLWALIQKIKSLRKIEQFKASGVAPKADKIAGQDELRTRGLIE